MTEPQATVTVHSLWMGLSRAYLLQGAHGLVLVDAGPPRFHRAVLAKMAALGCRDLRLIYITHAHVDHYGSAAALRRLTGAPIAVHPLDAPAMRHGETYLGRIRNQPLFSRHWLPRVERLLKVEPAPPDRTLQDGDRLDDYGLGATVIHLPGHTPGSTALLLDDGVALAGDLASAAGRAHAQRMYAVDWSQLAASLAKLQGLQPARVYTGHGRRPIAGREFQQLTAAMP